MLEVQVTLKTSTHTTQLSIVTKEMKASPTVVHVETAAAGIV